MPRKSRDEYNAYMRDYMLRRYRRRRAAAIAHLGGICVDCGSDQGLEFDHVDPNDKAFDISKWWSCAEEKFWTEIHKCALRCRSCHEEKSRVEADNEVEHGKGVSGKRRCRCEPCKTKKREYMRYYNRHGHAPVAQPG